MKVYFLRHGQSEYNVKELINCNKKIKVNLTKLGEKQAEKVATKLKKINFDVIFVSEFLRAKRTAEIVNKVLNKKIIADKRLNEVNIGFEGKSSLVFKKIAGENITKFKLPRKESFEDVVARVENFLSWLKKQKYGAVLVVTHEWLLKAANKIVNNITLEEAYKRSFKNCEIFSFEISTL